MNRILYIMGKSASGKDTVYRHLLEVLAVRPLVLYTTRPMREQEQNGREYFFVDRAFFERLNATGGVIEKRIYHTVYGEWIYFTASESIDLNASDYLGIGTLESYLRLRDYFGADSVIPLYIDVEDGLRLQRAIQREQAQAEPKYVEMCRRFIADSEDFSAQNLQQAGITRQFSNNQSLEACLNEIQAYLNQIQIKRN